LGQSAIEATRKSKVGRGCSCSNASAASAASVPGLNLDRNATYLDDIGADRGVIAPQATLMIRPAVGALEQLSKCVRKSIGGPRKACSLVDLRTTHLKGVISVACP